MPYIQKSEERKQHDSRGTLLSITDSQRDTVTDKAGEMGQEVKSNNIANRLERARLKERKSVGRLLHGSQQKPINA